MAQKKVLVGMSGGIDSTCACIMLQEKGYEVAGLTMRTWDSPSRFSSPSQELPDYVTEAKELAGKLGIEHHVADVRQEFKDVIVRNFVDEYMNGRTPNPCVLCNPLLKFRILARWAGRLSCPYIATGHYARLVETDGHIYIAAGDDEKKDQSYFLWRVSETVLRRCVFPLGGYTKQAVRGYLRSRGFEAKSKGGESMEVCFIDGDYRDFLREQVPDLDRRVGPGKFVNAAGVTLGVHKGFACYTVGQRKGLEIALGKPAYVLELDPVENTVMLGDAWQLKTGYMLVGRQRVVDERRFFREEGLSVRIRYRGSPVPCRVHVLDDGRWLIRFLDEASSVAPGQSAVFYAGRRVVAGALITSQHGIERYIDIIEKKWR